MARAAEEGVDRDEQERDPERGRSDQGDTHDREAANPVPDDERAQTRKQHEDAAAVRSRATPAECHEREKTDGDKPAA